MKNQIKLIIPSSFLLVLVRIHLTLNNWKVLMRHWFNGRNSDIVTKCQYRIIREKSKHCFFGYYDVTPFNHDSSLVLNLTTDGKSNNATINVYELKNDKNVPITKTSVWNWQQGCRLRWFPGRNDYIMFNDIVDGKYCCRIVDAAKGQTVKTIKEPLYDIDLTGRFGLTLNFAKLGIKRPGYGYTVLPFNDINPAEDGVDIVDIENDRTRRLFTFQQIVKHLENPHGRYKDYYLNHLSFSPSGKKFLFFLLDSSTKRHEAYMFVYDIGKSSIIPLEVHDKVSHYVWKDDNEIIATVYDDNMNCGYYVYNVPEKRKTKYNSISLDGHPSVYNSNALITDTYADNMFQHLYIVESNGESRELVRIFDDPYINGERRTDLHPRLDNSQKLVCVDANISGYRQMIVFNINE